MGNAFGSPLVALCAIVRVHEFLLLGESSGCYSSSHLLAALYFVVSSVNFSEMSMKPFENTGKSLLENVAILPKIRDSVEFLKISLIQSIRCTH